MSAFLLFDGSLLHGTQQGAELLQHDRRVALYDDLGEDDDEGDDDLKDLFDEPPHRTLH